MRKLSITALLVLTACQSTAVERSPSATLAAELPPVTSVVLKQRTSDYIPGTRGELRIHIDDITGGKVLVRLSQVGEDDLVPPTVMSTGDAVTFDLDKRPLALGLSHMVNHLIGADYARFAIGDPRAVCQAQMDAILARIETSSATFILEGADCDGKTLARHLRQKAAKAGDSVATGKDFLDTIATQTAPGGGAYGVRSLGDKPSPLAQWIRGRR